MIKETVLSKKNFNSITRINDQSFILKRIDGKEFLSSTNKSFDKYFVYTIVNDDGIEEEFLPVTINYNGKITGVVHYDQLASPRKTFNKIMTGRDYDRLIAENDEDYYMKTRDNNRIARIKELQFQKNSKTLVSILDGNEKIIENFLTGLGHGINVPRNLSDDYLKNGINEENTLELFNTLTKNYDDNSGSDLLELFTNDEKSLLAYNWFGLDIRDLTRKVNYIEEINTGLLNATGLELNEAYTHCHQMIQEVLTMSLRANKVWRESDNSEANDFLDYSKAAHEESMNQIHDLTLMVKEELTSLMKIYMRMQEVSVTLGQQKRAEELGNVTNEITKYYSLKTSGQLAIDSNNRAVHFLEGLQEALEASTAAMYAIAVTLPTAKPITVEISQDPYIKELEKPKKSWWKK